MLCILRRLFRASSSRPAYHSVRPCLESLEDRLVPTVAPHGGLVLPHVSVETVFCGDQWQTDPGLAQEAQDINRFFTTLTDSTYMDILNEYGVGRGGLRQQDFLSLSATTPGGHFVGTGGTPAVLADAQIQALLNDNIADPNSTVSYPDANTVYFVFTPPGVSVDLAVQNHWGGYHSSFTDDRNEAVYYAVVPYPGGHFVGTGLNSFEATTEISSHELTEAATNPDGVHGWYGARGTESEVGDEAEGLQGRYLGYVVQAEWSNVQQTAVLPPDATWFNWEDGLAAPNNVPAVASTLAHSNEFYGDFVTATYQRYLGRTPAAAERDGWVSALRSGLSDEQLEASFIGSVEYIQDHGGPGAGWVRGMYQNLLGRTPADAEVAGWVSYLHQGASPQTVAYSFAASFERECQHVQADYERYLGRDASADEVSGWATAFENGLANESVVAQFVGSTEYFQSHGSTVNDWLNAAYTDVLQRPIDAASLAAWDAALL
jgi:hypothetical protein